LRKDTYAKIPSLEGRQPAENHLCEVPSQEGHSI